MAKSKKPNIVIVGGGSVAWVPRLLRDMLLTPSLADANYVLFDIDKKASDLTKAFLDKLAKKLDVGATFTSTSRRSTALKDADYVIIAISTGGLDAMAHDLAIPEKFGIYHTVGDTSGPGGWARLIRNFDVFRKLAEDINKYAPHAMVLNYTNPMTGLTDVLARICEGPVIGLCHGLFENLRLLKRHYKVDSEDEIAINYAGINHFFWATEVNVGGKDALADLAKRLREESFTDIMNEAYKDEAGFVSAHREVATELLRITGVMPYLGDRHTCEFFPWYITDKKKLAKYKLIRTTVADRKKKFQSNRKRLQKMIKGAIPEEFLSRSRETAADIIDAHSQGRVFIDVGNVPNIGQIDNLPRGLVVETAVRIDRNGVTPLTFGSLPEMVAGFIEPYAHVIPMTVDACFMHDRNMALQALRLDPVCAKLDTDDLTDMGDQLLMAHRSFIKGMN